MSLNRIIKYIISCILLFLAIYINKIYNSNDNAKTQLLYWMCTSFVILTQQLIAFYKEKENEQKDNFNESEEDYKKQLFDKETQIKNYEIKYQNLSDDMTKLMFSRNDNSHYVFSIFIREYTGKIKKNLEYNLEIIINCLTDENILNDFKLVFPSNLIEIKQNEVQKNESSHILKSLIPTTNASKIEYNFRIKDKHNVYKYQKSCCILKIKNQYKKESFEFCLVIQDYEGYSSSDKIYNFNLV